MARKKKDAEQPAAQEQPAPPMHLSATVKQGVIEPADPAKPPARTDDPSTNPARWMHERLVNQIVEFEKALDADHEVGGRFVEGPNSEALHIENIASWGPDMVIFVGKYSDGRKFELLQHFTQVSLFLVAIRKGDEAEPRRIGFELRQALQDPPHPWGDPVS